MKTRVQLYVSAADLIAVDSAAKEAGESRSQYMMKAAIQRADSKDVFTKAQLEAIRSIVREEISK